MDCSDCITECPMNGSGNDMCISVETTPERGFRFRYKSKAKQTNADRIRAMSDEDLAKFIEEACCPPVCYTKHFDECQKEDCVPCWLAWLQEEVK